MASDYFTTTPEMKAPVDVAAAAGNYTSYQVPVDVEASGHYQQKEEDASNSKEVESVVNDQSQQDEHQKVELVTEGEVVHGQQEQGYTQVGGAENAKRDYVPRGSYQNQRGRRGARRGGGGYQNGRGGRGGGGGYQNGRYESYDQSGGNGYQRNYYNNRGRGRGGGGGGGNGHSYNNYQDPNVAVAS